MVAAVSFTGCKKYEDGPALTLLTKKMRVTGDWKIEQVLVNNVDQTSAFTSFAGANYMVSIKKDGTYTISGNWTDNGTWKFSDDKSEFITLSSQTGSTEDHETILKLKNKEFWLKSTDSSGNTTEVHYAQ